jgi:hypothetical protein
VQAAASFYQTLTTISFTLLGLWFVVLGLSHPDWRAPSRHRARLHVALCFFLPGVMGLVAILGGTNPLVWRLTFLLGGVMGLVESLRYMRAPDRLTGPGENVLGVLAAVLHAMVAAAAFIPAPVGGLAPLQLEGFVVTLVFLLGMVHVWRALSERPVTSR